MVQAGKTGYNGGVDTAPVFVSKEQQTMKRRHISGRRHGKKFQRARNRTRAINSPAFVMRGGIRL